MRGSQRISCRFIMLLGLLLPLAAWAESSPPPLFLAPLVLALDANRASLAGHAELFVDTDGN